MQSENVKRLNALDGARDNARILPLQLPSLARALKSSYHDAKMYSKGLTQAYEMQDFAFNMTMAIRAELEASNIAIPDPKTVQAIAALGKAWKDAQEQIRIHRGKPLPGSLSYEKVTRGRGRQQIGNVQSFIASMGAASVAGPVSEAELSEAEPSASAPDEASPPQA